MSNKAFLKIYVDQESAKALPRNTLMLRMDTAYGPNGVRTIRVHKDLGSVRREAGSNKEKWTGMEIELVPLFPTAARPGFAQRLRHTIDVGFQPWARLFMRSYEPALSIGIYISLPEDFGG